MYQRLQLEELQQSVLLVKRKTNTVPSQMAQVFLTVTKPFGERVTKQPVRKAIRPYFEAGQFEAVLKRSHSVEAKPATQEEITSMTVQLQELT